MTGTCEHLQPNGIVPEYDAVQVEGIRRIRMRAEQERPAAERRPRPREDGLAAVPG